MVELTRAKLRKFWTGILEDIYNGHHITDNRAHEAVSLAGIWET